MKTYEEARSFLYGLRNRGSRYGLQRMIRLLTLLDNPQNRYPVIHVAGTNGKGSVCALTESMLRQSGYKTGLYTSPHLVEQGERIQINRTILSREQILRWTLYLHPYAESMGEEDQEMYPSFFEFMTAMAFLVFAEENVDIAVIETGLGGRLDATNVVRKPLCTAITSIDLDHTDILGNSIAAIAGEKAGICKKGVPLVMGLVTPEAETIIRKKAGSSGCPVYSIRDIYGEDESAYPQTSLAGVFQRINAAIAVQIVKNLPSEFECGEQAIARGLQQAWWPGRWQSIKAGRQEIILDSTHNAEGARMLQKQLAKQFGDPRSQLVFVFGNVGVGRARAILEVIAPYAKKIVMVRPNQPHALSYNVMRQSVPAGYQGQLVNDTLEALIPEKNTISLNDDLPIIITGSIYLIGEICERLQLGAANKDSLQDSTNLF